MLGCCQAGGQGASTALIPLTWGHCGGLGPQVPPPSALAHHPETLIGPGGKPTCPPVGGGFAYLWLWVPISTLAHSHESLAHSPPPSQAAAYTRAPVWPVSCTLSQSTPVCSVDLLWLPSCGTRPRSPPPFCARLGPSVTRAQAHLTSLSRASPGPVWWCCVMLILALRDSH